MNTSRRAAFTLVEMLVVIGIIAVLISLLMPALRRARQQAQATVCASNERQLLAAWHLYVNENKGAVPVIVTRGHTWSSSLIGIDQSLMYYMSPANGGNGVLDYEHGAFWEYLSRENVRLDSPIASARQRVFNCPADSDFRAVATGNKLNLPGALERNFTYSWNILMKKSDETDGFPLADRINQILDPAHKIVLCEEERPNDGACYMGAGGSLGFGGGDDTPTWRHFGAGNWGFADGHVERLAPDDLGYSIVNSDTATARPIDMKKVNYYFGLALHN